MELMTLEEVSKYLKLSVHALYKMVEQKRIPAMKVGKMWRFDKAEIIDWLKQKRNIKPVKGKSK